MEAIEPRIVPFAAEAGWVPRVSTRLSPAWTTDWMSERGPRASCASSGSPRRRRAPVPRPVPVTADAAAPPGGVPALRSAPTPRSSRGSARPRARRCGGARRAASPSTSSRRSDGQHLMAHWSPVRPAGGRGSTRCTVAGVERLTDDAVAVTFDVPDELRDDYAFAPGQHLTLRAHDRRRGRPPVLLDLHRRLGGGGHRAPCAWPRQWSRAGGCPRGSTTSVAARRRRSR